MYHFKAIRRKLYAKINSEIGIYLTIIFKKIKISLIFTGHNWYDAWTYSAPFQNDQMKTAEGTF